MLNGGITIRAEAGVVLDHPLREVTHQTKIDQNSLRGLLAQNDIRRFDIAVQHILLMQRSEGGSHLTDIVQGVWLWHDAMFGYIAL